MRISCQSLEIMRTLESLGSSYGLEIERLADGVPRGKGNLPANHAQAMSTVHHIGSDFTNQDVSESFSLYCVHRCNVSSGEKVPGRLIESVCPTW